MRLFPLLFIVLLLSSCTASVIEEQKGVQTISTDQFYALTQTESNAIILDVRTPAEFNEAHIENAVLMDFYQSDFRSQLDALNKDETYLIYCRSGSRSGQTLTLMKELGFTSVYNLNGGINSWKAQGLPSI